MVRFGVIMRRASAVSVVGSDLPHKVYEFVDGVTGVHGVLLNYYLFENAGAHAKGIWFGATARAQPG
jgi:hypothetical protein